jgi:fibronectin type 3 domain-containing protein
MRAYLKVGDKVVYGEMSEPVENQLHISRCKVYFTKTGDLPPLQDDFEKYIEVRYGDRVLTRDEDYYLYISSYQYSVTYSNLLEAKLTLYSECDEYIGSAKYTLVPIASEPVINKISVQNYGIKISWEEYSGCGYVIYRKTGSGSYSKIKTINDSETTSWTDTSATKSYTTYSYYIKAYTKSGSKTLYTNKSNVKSIKRIGTPTLKSVTDKKEGLVVKWDAVKGGKWYTIYRKTGNGSWKNIATTTCTEYVDKNTTVGTKYTYTVCCVSEYFNDKISYYKSNGITATRGFATTGTSENSSSVTVSWNKMSKANGYVVYRATSENGTYKKIATIKSNSTVSYTDKKLSFSKYYYYKVRPYSVKDGKTIYSDYQPIIKLRPTTKTVKITKAKATTPTKIKVTWDKISKVDGYQIYQSDSQFGTYTKVKTITKNSTTSYTVSGLKNTNRYYFKVRTYKKVNGKVYYGSFSTPKSHYIDMIANQYESYTDKTKRIWGTDYKKYYSSSKAAKKDMKTIKVKTWDINKKGKKYTRYHYLTVHKNIAFTVEAIFDEIYKGKEKFPIKSVGGYSWRGDDSISEHCLGLAIDINPNENAQFNINGKPSVGSFWKPGKNPYSIPKNGDVVKAFEKYGFGWGDWFLDFMHFSYFGW